MGKVSFITGGCRSGKSRYALNYTDALQGRKVYLATCPAGSDKEMNERVLKHREERAHLEHWSTVEEANGIEKVLGGDLDAHIMVDCLTLWVSNLMYEASLKGQVLGEADISKRVQVLMETAGKRVGETVFVSNETGMGIVPENDLARQFRDLLGRCNQIVATHSDHMVFMVSGQAWVMKGP